MSAAPLLSRAGHPPLWGQDQVQSGFRTARGKRVVLVEDSLVRGTTLEKVIPMLRQAGAREIHMRIAAPPTTNSASMASTRRPVKSCSLRSTRSKRSATTSRPTRWTTSAGTACIPSWTARARASATPALPATTQSRFRPITDRISCVCSKPPTTRSAADPRALVAALIWRERRDSISMSLDD